MDSNILAPISFDSDTKTERAIAIARHLAKPEARITLLHVMEQVPGYAITYLPADYVTQSRAAVEAELHQMALTLPHGRGVVVEGRDIGTVVFPDADHGIFRPTVDEPDQPYRWRRRPPGYYEALFDWIADLDL